MYLKGGLNMRLNSGDTAPKTGSYKVIDDQTGRQINHVYMNEGDTLPPTQSSDCHYEID